MAEHHSRWKMAVCYHCRALNHAPIMAWRAPESPSCAAEEVIKRSLDGQSRESLRNTPSLGKSLHLKQVVSVFRIDRAFSISQNSHCGSCENISVRILWEAKWEFQIIISLSRMLYFWDEHITQQGWLQSYASQRWAYYLGLFSLQGGSDLGECAETHLMIRRCIEAWQVKTIHPVIFLRDYTAMH